MKQSILACLILVSIVAVGCDRSDLEYRNLREEEQKAKKHVAAASTACKYHIEHSIRSEVSYYGEFLYDFDPKLTAQLEKVLPSPPRVFDDPTVIFSRFDVITRRGKAGVVRYLGAKLMVKDEWGDWDRLFYFCDYNTKTGEVEGMVIYDREDV